MRSMRAGLSRRALLGAGMAAVVPFARSASAATFDWMQFKGERIEVFLQKSPRADMLQAQETEFQALTGIKVLSEQVPEQQHRQKFMIEFASGHPSFDVVNVAPHVQKRLLGKTKWLLDLRPILADPALTSPDFDFGDVSQSAIDYATHPDGRMDMVMNNLDYNILYWNKALFAEKSVPYPKSLTDLIETARQLNDPSKGVAGFVARGIKNANTSTWGAMMLGWGRYGIDPDLTVHTTSPEAVASAQLYQTLMRNYAPPGVASFNWNESQTTFAQGRAAIWIDASGFAQPLENPKMSRVAGKVGYGVIPPGPIAHYSGLSGDALGIPAATSRKGPAWLYIQWACGKTVMTRQLASGAGVPPRASAFAAVRQDPESKVPVEWLDCVAASALIARPHHPQIVAVTEYRDIFGIALTNMIGGADPATELAAATQQFMPVLARTET
jgi:multiple sugar transport system substrate-binding protein